ncbi:MAG: hypothetical protein ACJA01_001525 [Saprospiraceae bacterium]|jgi:hypothetical protein
MNRYFNTVLLLSLLIGINKIEGQISQVPDDFICDVPSFSESFENGIPAGWIGLESDSAKLSAFNEGWVIDQGATFTPNTGPSAAQDGTFYIYCDGSGPISRSDTASLLSPIINTGASRSPALQFYVNMHGQSGSLIVNVLEGGNKTQVLGPISAAIPGGLHLASVWEEVFIDLSAYQAKDIQIEFATIKPAGSNAGDIAIDNIRICNSTNAVPTLSEWAIMVLMLIILIVGIVSLKERSKGFVEIRP